MSIWHNIQNNIDKIKNIIDDTMPINDTIEAPDAFVVAYTQVYDNVTKIEIHLSNIMDNFRKLFSFDPCPGKDASDVEQMKRILRDTIHVMSEFTVKFTELYVNNGKIHNTFKNDMMKYVIKLDIINVNAGLAKLKSTITVFLTTLESVESSVSKHEKHNKNTHDMYM